MNSAMTLSIRSAATAINLFSWRAFCVGACGMLGCGSTSSIALVGYVDAGSQSVSSGDGSAGAANQLAVVIGPASVEVCAGQCVELSAEASGGVAPYAYEWGQGVSGDGGVARVCPTTTTTYTVTATDGAATLGEFSSGPGMGSGQVTVMVSPTCSDAGTPVGDAACPFAGSAPPESGHYAGTVSCGPGSMWNSYTGGDAAVTTTPDGGGGMLGTISLDLTVDPNGAQQSGTWYFQWSLAVIAGGGSLQGTLECAGSELDATFVNSTWGLPGGNMTVISTGGLSGSVTAVRTPGSPGAIDGFFTYTSSVGGMMGDVCVGSYTATLQPGDN